MITPFQASHSFLHYHTSIWDHFYSSWRAFLFLLVQTCWLWIISGFVCLESVLSSFYKIIFTDRRILAWQSLFFQHWLSLILLKTAVSLIAASLKMCFFSLENSTIFLHVFSCLVLVLFAFILHSFMEFLESVGKLLFS